MCPPASSAPIVSSARTISPTPIRSRRRPGCSAIHGCGRGPRGAGRFGAVPFGLGAVRRGDFVGRRGGASVFDRRFGVVAVPATLPASPYIHNATETFYMCPYTIAMPDDAERREIGAQAEAHATELCIISVAARHDPLYPLATSHPALWVRQPLPNGA